MALVDLVAWCREVSVDSLDGVTISGGEPFDQPEALLALLGCLCQWRIQSARRFDILLYSGYSEKRLRRDFANYLLKLDAIVAGPYREATEGVKIYCGSDNQQMCVLSPLGEERYGSARTVDWKSGMQLAVDDEGIWMIGIPRPNDLKRFEAGCLKKGLILEKPSWRC